MVTGGYTDGWLLWSSETLKKDLSVDAIKKIRKFDAYCCVPSQSDYRETIGNYFNKYHPLEFKPSPKDITIIDGGHKAVIVLEDFTDFLSLLQLKGGQSQSDFIILNSVASAERAAPILQSYQEVFLMLNHDKAGIAAMEKLLAAGISFTDASGFYNGFNDINEYLAAGRQASLQPQIRRFAPEERSRGIGR